MRRGDEVWAGLEGASARTAAQWTTALNYNTSTPAELIIELFDWYEGHYRFAPLCRADLPAAARDAALSHPNTTIRIAAAEYGRLTPEQWDRLSASFDDEAGRAFVADKRDEFTYRERFPHLGVGVELPPRAKKGSAVPPSTTSTPLPPLPPSTPDEIAAWAAQVPEPDPQSGLRSLCPWWIGALHDDPEAMRQLAASPNPAIRRGVARARHLPADVVDRLAHDEDRVVRIHLTESCDTTPPEVLLEVLLDTWSRWPPGFPAPDRPRSHPNFPTTGLLHHADDPTPRLRVLALNDKSATTTLVDRLAADPDPLVRMEALGDPRLSPAILAAALVDETAAYSAARNPALPVPVMRRMIDVAKRAE